MNGFKIWLDQKSGYDLIVLLTVAALILVMIASAGTTRCFAPHDGWLKFLTDLGLWGNIIGAAMALFVLVRTLRETRRSTRLSLMSGMYHDYQTRYSDMLAYSSRIERIIENLQVINSLQIGDPGIFKAVSSIKEELVELENLDSLHTLSKSTVRKDLDYLRSAADHRLGFQLDVGKCLITADNALETVNFEKDMKGSFLNSLMKD